MNGDLPRDSWGSSVSNGLMTALGVFLRGKMSDEDNYG